MNTETVDKSFDGCPCDFHTKVLTQETARIELFKPLDTGENAPASVLIERFWHLWDARIRSIHFYEDESAKKASKHFVCTNCGYSPTNRSTWCDKGCGSDYNQMIEVTEPLLKYLASREQQVAENAARAIVEAVKNREPIAAYGLIEGDKRKAEVFLRLQHSQWEGDVANAASAAAPFLNPKGE